MNAFDRVRRQGLRCVLLLAVLAEGVACRTVSSLGVNACQQDDDCPRNMRCAGDGACRAQSEQGQATPEGMIGSDASAQDSAGSKRQVAAQGGAPAASDPGVGAQGGNGASPPSAMSTPPGPPGLADAGAAFPSITPMGMAPAIATLGEACQQLDARACVSTKSLRRLRCDGARWVADGYCPDDGSAFCDSNPGPQAGTCVIASASCDAAHRGRPVCIGPNVHTCDAIEGSARLTIECTGDTPDCIDGQCSCVSRCGGECRSLQYDSQNCGSCGFACPLGMCVRGQCQPAVLVREPELGYHLLVDDTTLYWTTSESDAKLMSMPLQGGEPSLLAMIGEPNKQTLLLDESFIYIADAKSGVLSKVPVKGGVPSVLANAQPSIRDLAQDESNLYWVTGVGDELLDVVKMPKTGGAVTLLSRETRPSGILVDDGYLYFANGGAIEIVRMSRDGGEPVRTRTNDWPTPMGIVNGQLYFEELGVSRMPAAGGPIVRVLMDRDFAWNVFEYPNVIWRDVAGLMSRSLANADPPQLLLGTNALRSFALGKNAVYVGVDDRIVTLPRPAQ